MKRLFYFYITVIISFFVMIGIFIHLCIEAPSLTQYEKLFPDLYRQKDDFTKIHITTSSEKIIAEKNGHIWLLPKQANYPVDKVALLKLIEWLESFKIISKKTDNPKDFGHLKLNPPQQNKQDDGTRITIFNNAKRPVIDIIIGDRLSAYMMRGKRRYFMRMVFDTQSYLVETLRPIDFKQQFFISGIKGLPVIDDVSHVKVFLDKKESYHFKNTKFLVENSDVKDPSFLPLSIPQGFKLLYPEISSDYVRAILTKIHPIAIETLSSQIPEIKDWVELSLYNNEKIKISFFKKRGNYYLMIDLNKKSDKYFYKISKNDYLGILQPFSAFLTKDDVDSLMRDVKNDL